MKKIVFLFSAVLCAALPLSACSDDEAGETPVDPVDLTLTVEQSTVVDLPFGGVAPGDADAPVVTITTTAPSWKITRDTGNDWLYATITTGMKGTTRTRIWAEANDGLQPRTATMTVTAAGCPPAKITVTQLAFSLINGEEPYIEPDKSGMDKSASEIASEMGMAWNLGNGLESTPSETTWGNPATTKAMIDAVAAKGFGAVRIPVSWYAHTDLADVNHVSVVWLDRVQEVVDYCIDNDLYVILNSHYDLGWLNHVSNADKEGTAAKLADLWKQIATRFRDYDERLIFAGANEINDETSPAEMYEVENYYMQTFVNTVRATGGRNYYRCLAVQPYNTNIDMMVQHFVVPADREDVSGRLMVECHYYDPWQFCGLEEDASWGARMYLWDKYLPNYDTAGDEYKAAHVDRQMEKFADFCSANGVAGILGEFAAIYHHDLAESKGELEKHKEARAYWHYCVARVCAQNDLVPVLWDMGITTNNTMGFFNRATMSWDHPSVVNALFDGYNGNAFSYREN